MFEIVVQIDPQFPKCSDFNSILSNLNSMDLRQENLLTCLAYENTPYMGFFLNEIKEISNPEVFYDSEKITKYYNFQIKII